MKKLLFVLPAALLLTASFARADAPEKWNKLCAMCHGKDGKGGTPMGQKLKVGDMTTAEWQKSHDDATMKKVVRNGNPAAKKPAMSVEKLPDADLDAVIKFVRSLKK